MAETAFPAEVWIENTNRCNADCVMCPRDRHIRPQGVMDLRLFEKLIDEIAQHREAVTRVHLHNYGEPLLDDQLCRRIRIAKERGIDFTYFVTNASLLTPELSRELIESGLDSFKVSFYGTDRESYAATMRGLDFENALSNVAAFFRAREALNSSTPRVLMQYISQETNGGKEQRFREIFEGMISEEKGDRLLIVPLHNFGTGRRYRPLQRRPRTVCDYPWRVMVILWDGRVVPCCMDFNGAMPLGDAGRNSIAEIWNGADYLKIRDDFLRLAYDKHEVCSRCSEVR